MPRKRAARPRDARKEIAFSLGPPGWGRVAEGWRTGGVVPTVEELLGGYEAVAAALESGKITLKGLPPEVVRGAVRDIRLHASVYQVNLDYFHDRLKERQGILQDIREKLASGKHTGAGEQQLRAELRHFEEVWPVIIMEELTQSALSSGIALGALGAWVGIEPVLLTARHGVAFREGPKGPRRDPLAKELERMLEADPGLTAEKVLDAWADELGLPDCIQEVAGGVVYWRDLHLVERTTTREALERRLKRLHHARRTQ